MNITMLTSVILHLRTKERWVFCALNSFFPPRPWCTVKNWLVLESCISNGHQPQLSILWNFKERFNMSAFSTAGKYIFLFINWSISPRVSIKCQCIKAFSPTKLWGKEESVAQPYVVGDKDLLNHWNTLQSSGGHMLNKPMPCCQHQSYHNCPLACNPMHTLLWANTIQCSETYFHSYMATMPTQFPEQAVKAGGAEVETTNHRDRAGKQAMAAPSNSECLFVQPNEQAAIISQQWTPFWSGSPLLSAEKPSFSSILTGQPAHILD